MTLARKLSAAFEEGAKENSWIAGSARLKNLDPLVRVAARARFAKILERARRATTLDDPAHVLRLAALLAVKPEAECDFDDSASVRAELAALGPRTIPKQGPWWTLGAGALLVGIVVGALFLRRALAPFDARATPAGRALGEGLTRFVAAVNRDAASERGVLGGARAATTGPEARRAFGDDGVARLVRLLDAAGFRLDTALRPVVTEGSHMLDDVPRILELTPEDRLLELRNASRFLAAARRNA